MIILPDNQIHNLRRLGVERQTKNSENFLSCTLQLKMVASYFLEQSFLFGCVGSPGVHLVLAIPSDYAFRRPDAAENSG